MTNQLSAAFLRAFLTASLSAISTGLATYQTGADNTTILVTAITAFVTPFITRGGLEGLYDTNRDKNGQVNNADVGAKARGGDDFEGELILAPRELWAEVGSDFLPIVGMRTNRKTKKIEYFVQGRSSAPYFVDDVDQIVDQPPARR